MFWFVLIVLLLFLWTFALLALDGPNLDHYDTPVGEVFDAHPDDPAANEKFFVILRKVRDDAIKTKSWKKGFQIVLDFADNLSAGLETDAEFVSVKANGVPCEWAIAPDADPKRRILFLHGGAFLIGSPKGHRKYADKLSHIANAAVLSVDYRMLPKHKRLAATVDAQAAYKWLLENGPDGPAELNWLLVAGDSAGGNLALTMSGWSKDSGLRKPDGVIAFSPHADSTISAPTYKANRETDPILGEGLGPLSRLPKTLGLWFSLLSMRGNPSNPLMSPLFGDLGDLAPTLIHASTSEMLLGDSVRYTNKATAAGSNVKLQLWKDQLHDWHLFNMGTGSAISAWNEVENFIKKETLQPGFVSFKPQKVELGKSA